jgi:ABC-2 type transport system ATP-binding protein
MKKQIEFINVVKKYSNLIALKELSFSVNSNEFVALIGNNGCGKTTTINILCNIISYDKGDVFLFERRVTPYYVSYKNKLGILLSKPILVNEFTPKEYLTFVCKFQNVDPSEIQQRVEEIISIFEIVNSNCKRIDNYSSGEQMKISFASAVIHNPDILVLDEPFIHIDIQTIDFILNLLSSFKYKKTLFITSHNLDIISSLCERFLIMDDGRIIDDFSKSSNTSIESIKTLIKERIVKHQSGFKTLDWLK